MDIFHFDNFRNGIFIDYAGNIVSPDKGIINYE